MYVYVYGHGHGHAYGETKTAGARVTLHAMARTEGVASNQVTDVAAERAIRLARALVENVGKVLEGKREVVELAVTSLLARGTVTNSVARHISLFVPQPGRTGCFALVVSYSQSTAICVSGVSG